jgi:hypothetical protein
MEVILFSNDDVKLIKNTNSYYFLFSTIDNGSFLKKNIKTKDLINLKTILTNMDINQINEEDDYSEKISSK